MDKFDPDPGAQLRWVPRVLALLVTLCLLLAAWVWFKILHTWNDQFLDGVEQLSYSSAV